MTMDLTHTPNRSEMLGALLACIEICRDDQRGYAAAAAAAQNVNIATFLDAKSKERMEFIAALEHAVQKLGAPSLRSDGTPNASTSYRGWKPAPTGAPRTDQRIVEDCVRGEQVTLRSYQAALLRGSIVALPADIQVVLRQQYATLHRSLEELRRLRHP